MERHWGFYPLARADVDRLVAENSGQTYRDAHSEGVAQMRCGRCRKDVKGW